MKALVTGGAGFIGSHLSERLAREGAETLVLDDLSVGKRENVPGGARLLVGDVRDPDVVAPLLQGVDVVFHLAAKVTIRGSVDRFWDDAQTTLLGTLSVLEALRRAATRPRRIVYASSMAVYGEAERLPIPESAALRPQSPYGIAKMACERYVHEIAATLGVESVALRYFNTFGERQALTPYVGVLTIFMDRMLRGEPATIFGTGAQVRDFVYAGDVAAATWLAATTPGCTGMTFNVGTGAGTTVRELHDLLAAATGGSAPPLHAPLPAGEPTDSVADVALAQERLGFRARQTIASKIPDLVALARR
ncbi:MAG: NAD-dependent epimerase/dehydratase family protein [Acidobacteriota bacterium]